ncbi:MAG TPA: M56 family metallopeptidase, partial [Flavobacterium sp.]|nr:M56 family metallopeptidase [Flavobacterium sp.]
MLLGLITSVILPIITITKTVWIEPKPIVFEESFFIHHFSDEIMMDTIATEVQKTEINWSYIVAGFYVLGMLFFLVKFVLSSLSLNKILHKSPITKQNGFKFIDSKNVKTPFSFFNYIAFDSTSFSEVELQNIIIHEKVHSKQKHSFDIILSEIFSIVFWLNPFVWLYKKAIQQNLEFIADNQAVKSSENKIVYQKTLLKITLQSENQLALANLFYQSLIKKRIIMLNKNQSKNRSLWKFTFILPILVVFVMQFQTKVVAQEKKNRSEEIVYQGKQGESALITADTIVWVDDFAKSYDDRTNQSTGEKFVLQAGSSEEVKAILKDKEFAYKKLGKNPLIIVNGKEIGNKDFVLNNKDVLLNNMDILSFKTKGTVTHYDKESAVKKFGEKAKDGAIVIEGKDTKISSSSTEKELIKFLKSAKDYNKIEIFNRWGVLMYTLKPNEKIDEQKLNLLDDGTYYYAIENKSGEKENGYVYKGEKSATTKQ